MNPALFSTPALADRLAGYGQAIADRGAPRWDDDPRQIIEVLHEAAARLRGEAVPAEAIGRPVGPPPGTPLDFVGLCERDAALMHGQAGRHGAGLAHLAGVVANLAKAVAAYMEEVDQGRDGVIERMHALECQTRDEAGRCVIEGLGRSVNEAHGYIDRLAERVCALEDRNEYAAQRFGQLAGAYGIDGPEAGVPLPDLSQEA